MINSGDTYTDPIMGVELVAVKSSLFSDGLCCNCYYNDKRCKHVPCLDITAENTDLIFVLKDKPIQHVRV